MTTWRLLIGLVVLVLLCGFGFVAFAWRPAVASRDMAQALAFPPERIAEGPKLASAGFCSTCHTVQGGGRYAGGYAMNTGFGTVYSTNITPDAETGIGRWTEPGFARAMRQGLAPDGSHLLPAFPYTHYTMLTDDDVAALYAFFMTRAPVHAEARANTIPFPLNMRLLQAGWKLLFFRPGRFKPDASEDPAWNRGAYLAEGLSHCAACHTSRNLLGAEKSSHAYDGAAVDGWIAPALDRSNPSPVAWTALDLTTYLHQGVSASHGSAAGSMAEVVHGLSALDGADIRAIGTYIASKGDPAASGAAIEGAVTKILARSGRDLGGTQDPDAKLYASACAACHFNSGQRPIIDRPELGLTSALTLSEPTNFFQVVLHGISVPDGISGVSMPAYGSSFSDAELARLAAYIRRTRTDLPPWPDLEKKVAAVRATSAP